MPLSRQIRSKSTSTGGRAYFAGEDLAVVREDLLRHPVRPQSGQEAIPDQLGALPRHQPGGHTESGMGLFRSGGSAHGTQTLEVAG